MNTTNQNFVTGLFSLITLVASLILTILSILKMKLDIGEKLKKKRGQKATSKNRSTSSHRDESLKPPVNMEIIIDILFFLLFSIGSIDAIVEFLSNTVPVFTLIATLFFVPIYSFMLLSKEQGNYKLAGLVGLFISLALWITLGTQRLMLVFSYPNNSTIAMLFSLVVNLAVVPLLVFSLVSSRRIIRYIEDTVTNQ